MSIPNRVLFPRSLFWSAMLCAILLQACTPKRNILVPVHTEVPDVELHLEKVDVPEMQTCEKNGVEMVCLTKDGLDTLNRNMLKHIALVRQCRAIREYYSASK